MTQRVLATHPAVDTAAEPWILLPLLYSCRRLGAYAEYGHKLAVDAIEDFADGSPGGKVAYLQELREFVLRLYAHRTKPGARYFVDKSPRYHLIADDLFGLFGDGKFIFLWRNPLAIVASIMETWAKGRWNLFEYDVDLFDGLASLVDAQARHAERAISIRFEDLVSGDRSTWKRLFKHLDLDLDESKLLQFQGVKLDGRMGDLAGSQAYSSLSVEPIMKWKSVLGNPLRKSWCRRYLKWIGRERLAAMGYDIDRLRGELDKLPVTSRYLLSDIGRLLLGIAIKSLELRIMHDKWMRKKTGRRPVAHT